MSRKLVACVAMASCLVLPLAASVSLRGGEVVRIAESVGDDLFAGAKALSMEGNVASDLVAAAQDLELVGRVGDSAMVGGERVNLTGIVGDDAYLAAEHVDFSGRVGSDLLVACRSFRGWSAAVVGGDMRAFANSLDIRGRIGGDLVALAQRTVIDGVVEGSVNLNVSELELGPKAVIKGDLHYTSGKEMVRREGAVVRGEVVFTPKLAEETEERMIKTFFDGFISRLISFLSAVLVGALIIGISRRHARVVRDQLRKQPFANLLWGFIFLVAVPVASLLLLITAIGIPLSFFLAFFYVIALYVGSVFAALGLGDLLAEKMLRKKDNFYLAVALGALLLWLVRYLPVLGGISVFLAVLWGTGAFLISRRTLFREARAKKIV